MDNSYSPVNGINIIDCEEKNKFKIEFVFDIGKTTIVFDYDDLVFIGSEKSALKKMLPFMVILNHMLDEYKNESESEDN